MVLAIRDKTGFLYLILLTGIVIFYLSQTITNNLSIPPQQEFKSQFTGAPQILKPVKWKYTSPEKVVIGEEIELVFEANIDKDWYLYSSDFDPNLGPVVTTFTFEPHSSFQLVKSIKPIKPLKKFDEMWGGEYTYFKKTGKFIQKIKVLEEKLVITGAVSGQTCSDKSGQCVQVEDDFSFKNISVIKSAKKVNSAITTADSSKTIDTIKKMEVPQVAPPPIPNKKLHEINKSLKETGTQNDSKSLLEFVLLAFAAGLIALVTPCVFPMVPMTVSFFTHSSSTRAQAIKKAIIYGVSIVVIYGFIGLALSRFNGPEVANVLATHWAPNLLFFFIFFFFGLSFLGMFEITLPSSFVNKVDAQSEKGGIWGIFFMAFTIVLVSFSCTGPIVGGILVLAAGGEVIKPVLGMLSYSLAFAIPFTLFAMFPNWLNKLPKSGGWLNVIKVTLGFIELALGLKFFSVADQVYHWNLLDREIYIAIWVVLFILLGVYHLGKLRLPHDTEIKVTPVPRLLMAILSFSFSAYLIPGLFGAPLKALSGYLPPMTTHDFDVPGIIRQYSASSPQKTDAFLCEDPRYGDSLHLPHGLQGFFDYKQALKCAREKNIPLFIDFTGHGCVNCREMEANVWADPSVLKILRSDYLIVALYVDDPFQVPESEIYVSTYDKKTKKTIGSQNSDLQIRKFGNNAQPFYVLLNPYTEEPLTLPLGYESSIPKFIKFLKEGKEKFRREINKK